MEYLHKKLDGLSENLDFNFHSKCEKLKLVDLSFADNLLLFSMGDKVSVTMMMDIFSSFSLSIGLKVNPNKCYLYCGGMLEGEQEAIMKITGLCKGNLPFRYLGIPLSSKKLSNNQCLVLVDCIVAKLSHWSSHMLSYAGRVQLVNRVSFGSVNYWLSCIPLPKGVIKCIEAKCRSFVWSGKSSITRKAPVAWEKMCLPKNLGGIGIINLQVPDERLVLGLSESLAKSGVEGPGVRYTKSVWENVLRWMQVRHGPRGWNEEMAWLIKICKSRKWRGHIVKMAIAEVIYETWWDRNMVVHSIENSNRDTTKRVIDNIVYRLWAYPKYREKLDLMLMP
ncbi:uncharacterized protein LOC131604537 [Vicia villosa]|uniref:uncharacterized protein LOC131604537 n=1 Tax=Vicia villosa TaxID=3911 RepID=UPI00273BB368|nr:uncharacterized protein LOC131604537 [Vicia villosa]